MSPYGETNFLPIGELSAYQSRWTIKGKLTSKSAIRTFQKGSSEGKVFSAEIVDGSGTDIRASFFNEAATKFFEILNVGKAFTFSRGTVKVANKQYNNCSSRYELAFDRDAQISEVEDDTEAYTVQYSFTDLKTAQMKELPCRVDLCGVLTQFRPVTTITTRDGRELTKRDITITDDTATKMDVTLWGEKGQLAEADLASNPVVALKSILLKEWNGEKSGGTIESSSVELRPDVPEAKRIAQWWAASGSTRSFANITDIKSVQDKPAAPFRVDLCGVVVQFRPFSTVNAKDGRELLKRDITIADDTGTSMEVTLWGDKGKRPDADFENCPIILVTGVFVKEFNGGRNGSTLDSSTVVLKPEMAEATRIAQWWAGGGSSQSLVSLRGAGGVGTGGGRDAEVCTIETMRRKAEHVIEQTHFKIYARLAIVQLQKQGEVQRLQYLACAELRDGSYGKLPCNRRVDGSGFCVSCNMAGKTASRLNLRCHFADTTNAAWLTTFHEPAEQVLGMQADAVAEIDVGSEREKLESLLKQRYFIEPMEITVRSKLDSYMGEPRPNSTCVGAVPVNRKVHGRKMLSEIKEMLAASV